MYQSTSFLFRSLTDEEETQFRAYARQTPPADLSKWAIYHPVCREEWIKLGLGSTSEPRPDAE